MSTNPRGSCLLHQRYKSVRKGRPQRAPSSGPRPFRGTRTDQGSFLPSIHKLTNSEILTPPLTPRKHLMPFLLLAPANSSLNYCISQKVPSGFSITSYGNH